jgi:hypothetical protein
MGQGSPKPDPYLMQHMLAAHTSTDQVGPQAEKAQVKTLVLTHLVPGNTPREKWEEARAGFSGDFYVGEDLMHFGIGAPTPDRDPHTEPAVLDTEMGRELVGDGRR